MRHATDEMVRWSFEFIIETIIMHFVTHVCIFFSLFQLARLYLLGAHTCPFHYPGVDTIHF